MINNSPTLELYEAELQRTRVALLECYTLKQTGRPVQPGAWSALAIMRHLYLSELSSAKIFRSADRVCEKRSAVSDEELEQERQMLSHFFSDRSIRVEAPERIQPVDIPPDYDPCAELASARQFLIQHARALSDDQRRSLFFRHPLRGDLSLYGWLWFIAAHEARHTVQMSELKTSD